MKKVLDGQTRRIGAIFNEVDLNFIEVGNSILRMAFPDYTLKGYAITEPTAPTLYDCYLVQADATVWEIVCEKNEVLYWNGVAWELLPWKITQINEALQFLFFDAGKIAIEPIAGLDATNVQTSLELITSALIAASINIPTSGSGSGSA